MSVTFQILPEIQAGCASTPICWHHFQEVFLQIGNFHRLTRTICNVTGARRSAGFWAAVTLEERCRCLHCQVAQSCLHDIGAPQKHTKSKARIFAHKARGLLPPDHLKLKGGYLNAA
jgi:hypothetical protein